MSPAASADSTASDRKRPRSLSPVRALRASPAAPSSPTATAIAFVQAIPRKADPNASQSAEAFKPLAVAVADEDDGNEDGEETDTEVEDYAMLDEEKEEEEEDKDTAGSERERESRESDQREEEMRAPEPVAAMAGCERQQQLHGGEGGPAGSDNDDEAWTTPMVLAVREELTKDEQTRELEPESSDQQLHRADDSVGDDEWITPMVLLVREEVSKAEPEREQDLEITQRASEMSDPPEKPAALQAGVVRMQSPTTDREDQWEQEKEARLRRFQERLAAKNGDDAPTPVRASHQVFRDRPALRKITAFIPGLPNLIQQLPLRFHRAELE